MARLKENDKKRLIADISTGQWSVRELAKKYGVSNATVQKYKAEMDEESEQVVNAGIAYKMGLALIQEPEKVNAIVNAVDERTKHLMFFNNSALKNQNIYNKGLEAIEDEIKNADDKDAAKSIAIANMAYLESHSRSTQRNKETVLGKEPSTTINNTNAQQNNEEKQIRVVIAK